jgi:hypothetical protein
MGEPSPSEMLEHAWRYFALHASQRISLFNFFLIVEGTMGAGLAACLRGSQFLNLLGVALGVLMAFVSFVFWKLDQRTAFLVKYAEVAIAEIENALPIAAARIISHEPAHSAERAGVGPVWTYGEIFRVVFVVMSVLGVAGGVLSFVRFAAGR